jgi:L-seryl-tRNA(Ser) seleniumtransferase
MSQLRRLPSVDHLLNTPRGQHLITAYGRPLTVDAIRTVLEVARDDFSRHKNIPEQAMILSEAAVRLDSWTGQTLQQVINATGVILHTNLGRAPLSQPALLAIQEISQGYCTLEYDLAKGVRGSRSIHAENLLKRLTGAEAALVVNNNAAALLAILSALAPRRRVLIARTQLVEIGGGFRVPEVMNQSGARLVEIGTTNRVHLSDYETALDEQPIALVLRAHRSNFQIIGFTSEPSLAEIVQVSHQADVPVVDDLGSGSLLDTSQFGMGHEPTVQESLAAGVDLVCFSGDKLLGGSQSGIILGRADLVARIKKHPLARAIRADKLCLAALSATLLHYLKDEAITHIPIWRMIAEPVDHIHQRASQWVQILGQGEVIPGQSTVGGGSLPEETLPTFLVSLNVASPNRVLARLRTTRPAIIARVQDERLVLDPRTVLFEQETTLIENLLKAIH